MSRKRVLIVDDDEYFVEALQLGFARTDFDLMLASNGEKALQFLGQSEPIDLVLSDFMMPEMNGIELVRRLKANVKLRNTPVVMMSSNIEREFRDRALELGVAAFLLKTEGADVIAAKAIEIIGGPAPAVSNRETQPAPTAHVQAMRQSLLSIIRLTAQMNGLPAEARNALIAAEKLVESLFAAVPEGR